MEESGGVVKKGCKNSHRETAKATCPGPLKHYREEACLQISLLLSRFLAILLLIYIFISFKML